MPTYFVAYSLLQVIGHVHLDIPDVTIHNPEDCVSDYDLIHTLERALEEWSPSPSPSLPPRLYIHDRLLDNRATLF